MCKRDEAVARFMDELREWGDKAAVGNLSPGDAEENVLDAMRGNLRSIMGAMGYGAEETEEACDTVQRSPGGNASAIMVVFEAPPRVVAYLDAVRFGDYERAELLLRARQG
jgi:hypothetical protein